jgi:hypothetical protein
MATKPSLARPAAKRKHRLITPGFALTMLILLGGIGGVTWLLLNLEDDRPERIARIEILSDALSGKGVTVEHSKDATTVSLVIPTDQAMVITERQANELALNARSRLGTWAVVKVKSPAGQSLGSAP